MPTLNKKSAREVLLSGLVMFTVLETMTPKVKGHGRLLEPPSRASMWRLGYGTPVDYHDNQLFCGGFAVRCTALSFTAFV